MLERVVEETSRDFYRVAARLLEVEVKVTGEDDLRLVETRDV
jgi:hypothetical protein